MIARLTPRVAVRLTPPRLRAAFLAVIAVVVAVTAAKYLAKAEKPSALGTQTRTAFLRWRPQVTALGDGVNIYARHNYPNPPVMALVLWPLMSLPPLTGAMAWFALKVGMAVGIVVVTVRLLGVRSAECGMRNEDPTNTSSGFHSAFRVPHSPLLPDWAKAAAILVGLHPMLGDLSHGNVNLFVAFVLFAALDLFRRRWDFSAGVVLALAVACKVTPALFLPYFAYKRAWKLLAGSAVGLMLWLAVVPGAVLGRDYNRELLTTWYEVMVKPFAVDGKVTSEHHNQSVPGLTFRLLTCEPSFLDYDADDRPVPAEFHNVADLGAVWAKRLVQACMGVFAVAVVLTCRSAARSGLGFAAELALVSVGMLLFSERTWKHHAVGLVLPAAVLLAAAVQLPRLRPWLFGALGLVVVLTVGPSLLPERGQDVAMIYGAYTAAFAVLAAGTAAVAGTSVTAAG